MLVSAVQQSDSYTHTHTHTHRGFLDSGKESACRRPQFDSWVRKICWGRDRLPTPVFLGFSCGSAGKQSICNVGDLGYIPGLGRSPREGKGYTRQYSGLENSMDCIVHGVAKSQTRLSDFHMYIDIDIDVHIYIYMFQIYIAVIYQILFCYRL